MSAAFQSVLPTEGSLTYLPSEIHQEPDESEAHQKFCSRSQRVSFDGTRLASNTRTLQNMSGSSAHVLLMFDT